jgi:hypothetical protein
MILFELSIITAFWCLGIEVAGLGNGMILYKFKTFCRRKVKDGKLIYKPIYECPYCMPTFHSVFGYLFTWVIVGGFEFKMFLLYPAVICISSAIIWLFLAIISFLGGNNNK